MKKKTLAGRIIYLFVISITFFSLSCATASFSSTQTLPFFKEAETGTLDNGLSYYILKNQKPAKRASLRLVVKAGSLHEEDDQRGIAHLVEHMSFNGSKNFAKNELIDFLESLGLSFGSDLNASTTFDKTVYKLEVPTDDPVAIATAFQVLEDWSRWVLFNEEEMAKERLVVQEEWRRSQGASQRVSQQLFETTFKNSLIAQRMPIGKMEDVLHTPTKRVKDFYRVWYRPDRMAVIAVGDFNKTEILDLIKKHFSHPRSAEPSPPEPQVSIKEHEQPWITILQDPEINNTEIILTSVSQPAKKMVTAGDYRDLLYNNLIFTMFNQRLNEITLQPDSPFVEVGAGSNNLFGLARVQILTAKANPQTGEEPLERLLTEIQRLRIHGFTQTELDRAKNDTLAGIDRTFDNIQNIQSESYAREIVAYFTDQVFAPGLEIEHALYHDYLPSVTLSQINAMLENFFPGKNQALILAYPEQQAAPDTETVASIRSKAATSSPPPYRDSFNDQLLIKTLPKPGKIIKEETLPDGDLVLLTLSNQTKIVYRASGEYSEKTVYFYAFSWGGTGKGPVSDRFNAKYAPLIRQKSGLGDFDPVQLQKNLSGVKASVSERIDNMGEVLYGSYDIDDQETFFQLLHLIFTKPRFTQNGWNRGREELLASVRRQQVAPEHAFQKAISGKLYQNSPWIHSLSMTELEQMSLEAASLIYKERFNTPGDFTMFFTGNLEINGFKQMLRTYLASLPAPEDPETWQDPGYRFLQKKESQVVSAGVEPKALVNITFPVYWDWEKDQIVTAQAAASVFTEILSKSIREAAGGTYSINAYFVPTARPKKGGLFAIEFGCDPDRVKELLNLVYDEISTLIDRSVDQNLLSAEIAKYRRKFETDSITDPYWIRQFANNIYYLGLPLREAGDLVTPEEYEQLVTTINVQTIARQMLSGNYLETVLLPTN